MDLDPDRMLHHPGFIGGVGSIVALKFAPGLTWPERAVNVVAGSLCALYGAPALIEWLRVTGDGLKGFIAFAIGMFGLSLAAAVLQGIREVRVAEAIQSWTKRG